MRFVVTGSAGFIGYNFCRKILAKGHKVVGIDNHNTEYPVEIKERRTKDLKTFENFEFIKLGIENEAIKSVLSGRHFDYVIHLAAKDKIYDDLETLKYSEYLNVNVVGTARIMEVARMTGAKKFIYTSTHSVYGNTKKHLLSEKRIIPNPASPHGASKIAAEQVVKFMSKRYGIDSIILRVFSVYGPDMRPHTLIPLVIKRVLEGKPIDLYQSRKASRDYIYIDDVVEYLYASLSKRVKFQIINVGTSHAYTNEEVVDEIAMALNKDTKKLAFTKHERDFEAMVAVHSRADIVRAQKILKYSPQVSFAEGIKRTVAWYQDNFSNLDLSVHT